MATAKTPSPILPFEGFPKQGMGWFQALAMAQSRDWFQAHKEDYERLWRGPMLSLLGELHQPLTRLYKRKLAPPKIFRLNRDVRFSKDKSPYKTNCSGLISFEGKSDGMGPVALYVHLGLDEAAACGIYFLEPDQLALLRKKVLSDKTGPKLARLIAVAKSKGQTLTSMQTLKRAPAGVPKDHPRVEILREKGMAMSFGDIPKRARYSAELKDWLLEQATIAAPVIRWAFANKIG